jgi:hypothetical protein
MVQTILPKPPPDPGKVEEAPKIGTGMVYDAKMRSRAIPMALASLTAPTPFMLTLANPVSIDGTADPERMTRATPAPDPTPACVSVMNPCGKPTLKPLLSPAAIIGAMIPMICQAAKPLSMLERMRGVGTRNGRTVCPVPKVPTSTLVTVALCMARVTPLATPTENWGTDVPSIPLATRAGAIAAVKPTEVKGIWLRPIG